MFALALTFLATPFLFGLARLVTTGSDWRYLAVAVASTLGASIAFWIRSLQAGTRVLVAGACSVLLAALASVVVGGRSAVSVGLVAAGFAFCSVLGAALLARSRRQKTTGSH